MNKTALILDGIDRGTIQTTLQTNEYQRILKLLNSSVKNWGSICKILEDDTSKEIIIIGKLTEHTLFRMCLPEYEKVVIRLLSLLKERKHLLFIYKDNLLGNFSFFHKTQISESVFEVDKKDDYFYYSEENIEEWISFYGVTINEDEYLAKVVAFINTMNQTLSVLPYEKLIDVEISGQNFIENIAEGLLFRIYIANKSIWSSEFDKFITLFRDYASTIRNQELKIKQDRTDLGIICSLYSVSNKITNTEINDLYKEFSSFMDICSSDPTEAEKLLEKTNLSNSDKQIILSKYIKESQRLVVDLKQERELKMLKIKHRLETEITEIKIDSSITEYIENSIPNTITNLDKLGFADNVQTQIININPQIINKVDGIVCNELNGNINYSIEELELQKLIEKHSNDITELTELQTALLEFKDSASSKEKKRGSWQKLYGFLGKIGEKVGDVGVNILTKYLEQQMNL